MQNRKRLSDIISDNSALEKVKKTWRTVEAAQDLSPVPRGMYRCRILAGELFQAKSGTAGYKATFEIVDGDYQGRRLWWDCWLTEAALPLAKRDLGKLGITDLSQLEESPPAGILLGVHAVVRRRDDGGEYNHVTRFEVVGVEPGDPFGPDQIDIDVSAPVPPAPAQQPVPTCGRRQAVIPPGVNGAGPYAEGY
jgi:hypothetical protein